MHSASVEIDSEHSMESVDRLINAAFWSLPAPALNLPWDDPMWAPVFGKAAKLDFGKRFVRAPHATNALSVLDSTPLETARSKCHQQEAYLKAVRQLRDVDWFEADEAYSHRALNRWRYIVEHNFHGSKVGLQLMRLMDDGANEVQIQNSLLDTFGIRSPSTLMKRACSLLKFIYWNVEHNPLREGKNLPGYPFEEVDVYQYLLYLRDTGASATTASSLLQALNFAAHVVGIAGAKEASKSARVQGAAARMFVLKRPLTQRKPLTKQMIMALENATVYSKSVVDRVAAGTFTWMLYARARFSDAQRAEKMIIDLTQSTNRGYIELHSRRVKTSSTKEKRSTFLPMTAVTRGLTGLDWGRSWILARATSGLSIEDFGSTPLLPAPSLAGGWCLRPLTSGEATAWMIELINQHGVEVGPGFGTHSLKATLLSWCAKRGLPPDVRLALGYHSQVGQDSTLTYSRDALARPLRKLESMLSEVRLGVFDPDANRSGRLQDNQTSSSGSAGLRDSELTDIPIPTSVPDDDPLGKDLGIRYGPTEEWESDWYALQSEEPTLPEDDVVLDLAPEGAVDSSSDDSSSGHSDSDGIEVDRRAESLVVASKKRVFRHTREDFVLYQHVKYGTLHLASQQGGKSKCGRPMGQYYKALPSEPEFDWPMCRHCYADVFDPDGLFFEENNVAQDVARG